jgi:uncharacterized tellurite resistance protein B-like protein/predicted Zn-ribbon and HTH transcriptional regulator
MAMRQRSANIQQLVANDPQFDESAFCRRVATAFFKIQDAWCAQDLKDARLFVSDGVAERYSLQFAEQRDENYRDQIESIGIDDLQIVDVDSSGIFDEISVRINSHAMRSRHSLCDGGRIGGSVSVERMVEIWSFLRLRGAVTDRGKPGLIEGNCPDCGAALSMNQTAQCPYCRSLLRNGQFDWVLCEVTQFSQWERTSDESVPGLEQLRERDAGFSRQALEDRASVIFWRRVRADRMGKIDPLRKVASDSFCDGYASTLKRPREYAGDCALGGVKMMRFIAACEGEVMDRIVASIRWSGKVMTVGIDGQRMGCGELFQTNVIVLGRQAGARTDVNRSVTSAHCPNCGAAESQSDASACPACGAVLNGGQDDWMLLDWRRFSDPATLSLLNPAGAGGLAERAPAYTAGLLAWAVKMAAADGKVDAKERALLDRFAAHDGCGAGEVDRMIAAALSGHLVGPEPADATEARDWLSAIVRVAKSDGRVDDEEMSLLKWLGRKANLSEKDIDALVEQMQIEEYGSARANVKAASSQGSKRAGLWLRE